MKEGADINGTVNEWTTLQILSLRKSDHFVLIQKLIEMGVNVSLSTPIFHFCQFGSWKIFKLFIENKVDLNTCARLGISPTSVIVRGIMCKRDKINKKVSRLLYLLKNGADFTFQKSMRKALFEEVKTFSGEDSVYLEKTILDFLKLTINFLVCFRILFVKIVSTHKFFPPKIILKKILLYMDNDCVITKSMYDSISHWAFYCWEQNSTPVPFFQHIFPQMKSKTLAKMLQNSKGSRSEKRSFSSMIKN
eukprot:TRINITY_DN3628_c0_g1_i1.p1 TRINITY_DN3628_c0_g1~~TRINITY_DN3628_c0_g1_i1.p1  ORF type:complete len:249 (-),score=41.75 TRINITY_DN3628_c0_g1_i1:27-773(-)